jgi:hypothetical protein
MQPWVPELFVEKHISFPLWESSQNLEDYFRLCCFVAFLVIVSSCITAWWWCWRWSLQIVLKACRNSHCHYCFGQLPANPMACNTCAIPLYCTETCRDKALGCGSDRATGGSLHLQNDIWSGEHKHECGGASWSAVLPTDAVLAARIFVRNQALGHLDNQVKILEPNLVDVVIQGPRQ